MERGIAVLHPLFFEPHMTRPAWNLLTGTLTRYVLLFVNIAIGVFLMPFTMHHLGQAQYGLWMLAASMTAYLQLLDLGYGNGLVRQLTQADGRGRAVSNRAAAIPPSLARRRIDGADGADPPRHPHRHRISHERIRRGDNRAPAVHADRVDRRRDCRRARGRELHRPPRGVRGD